MRPKRSNKPDNVEQTVRDIRRAIHRQFSVEEEIRIVLAGLRGEQGIADLCRKKGISQNLYYGGQVYSQCPPRHSRPLTNMPGV
jgi:transposase